MSGNKDTLRSNKTTVTDAGAGPDISGITIINGTRETDGRSGSGGKLIAAPRPNRDEFITERRYGCYRLGLLVAVVIIFVLIIGSVPVFVTTDNSKLILIVLIITLIVVGVLIFAYFEWQRRTALRMRQNSIRGNYSTMERRAKEQQKYSTSVKKKQQDDKKKPQIQYSLV